MSLQNSLYPDNQFDSLQFPNGRTIGNAKNAAKKLKKSSKSSKLFDAQNFIAQEYSNGRFKSWSQAMKNIPRHHVEKMKGKVIQLDDVERILKQHRKITWSGYDSVYWQHSSSSDLDQNSMSIAEQEKAFNITIAEKNAEFLYDAESIKIQAEYCCSVLDSLEPAWPCERRSLNSLNELKHVVERYANHKDKPLYISRGAVAVAAIFKGLSVESSNEWMGVHVTEESVRKLLNTLGNTNLITPI